MHKRATSSVLRTLYEIFGLLSIIAVFSYIGMQAIHDRELVVGRRGGMLYGEAAVVGGASFICVAAASVVLLFTRPSRSRKGRAKSIIIILLLAFCVLFTWALVLDTGTRHKLLQPSQGRASTP